jgi:signal transduction histidine kinase
VGARDGRREGSVENEGWRIKKDGTRFWGSVVITALTRDDGTIQGYAKITRDMTDRHRVEDLLRAESEKNEFLSLLTHELRGLLAPVRSALHVMGHSDLDPKSADHVRGVAVRQVEQMTRLLDDLLDLTQVTRGSIELRRERVDLAVMIGRAVEAASFLVRRAAATDSPSTCRSTSCGFTPTRRGWNSFFQPPGQRRQVYRAAWSNLGRCAAGGRQVVVRVRDSGIGIDPLMASRVFDLFTQLRRPRDFAAAGTGLGLALVRRLVELHGGTVEVVSAGRG